MSEGGAKMDAEMPECLFRNSDPVEPIVLTLQDGTSIGGLSDPRLWYLLSEFPRLSACSRLYHKQECKVELPACAFA